MSEEDRKEAELEAAMVFYRELIELKLRRGEEVHEDDELVIKMTEACNAFQRLMEPKMTVEQIAELEQF